jgi:hypothetical protein
MVETTRVSASRWDGDGVPDAELWVVGGSAADPERIELFLAQSQSRRALILSELPAPPRSRRGPGQNGADHDGSAGRACYLGLRPSTSQLRQALVRMLGAGDTSSQAAIRPVTLVPSTV